MPVIAIGGVKLENLDEVIKAGGDAVCAISATVATDDVEGSVKQFEQKVIELKNKYGLE